MFSYQPLIEALLIVYAFAFFALAIAVVDDWEQAVKQFRAGNRHEIPNAVDELLVPLLLVAFWFIAWPTIEIYKAYTRKYHGYG